MGLVTVLLKKATFGDADAVSQLCRLVYRELHQRAKRAMRRERPDHTLQPTVLVHDAFLRLAGKEGLSYVDRNHFYALAAREMWRILREHARAHRPRKIPLGDWAAFTADDSIDAVALTDALEKLAAIHERAAEVVQLRILGGMKFKEIAEYLSVSDRTVRNDWRAARALLKRILAPE
jgi:RNA polymerase sigma factor (TIGR02999 family)